MAIAHALVKSLLMVVSVSAASLGTSQATAQSTRLDRTNLLQHLHANGLTEPISTAEQWQKRRRAIIDGMVEVMGDFPDEPKQIPLNVQTSEEVDMGSYVRRLITYQSDGGTPVPAYLCLPKSVYAGNSTAPGVLCLHPTDNVVGHKVVVGLGGRPGRQYAAELAQRGYITIAPAYPHLANYWPNLSKLGYVSGSLKAVRDNMRAIDLLQAMPEVDAKNGFAAIGHSLGGHNAIYSAVFDQRIKVIVSSCGFDSFQDYFDGAERVWYFGKGWCQIRYMPRMSNYRGRLSEIPFDFHELLGALAPRKVFVSAPKGDSNFRWKSVDRCANTARPVFRLLGVESNLIVRHPDCDHNFPKDVRNSAYRVIDSVLRD